MPPVWKNVQEAVGTDQTYSQQAPSMLRHQLQHQMVFNNKIMFNVLFINLKLIKLSHKVGSIGQHFLQAALF
jgi:hypothetical protein